jgi:uncharacterized protein
MMASSSQFPQVKLSVESGLVSPGDTISVQDKLDVSSFTIGGRQIELEDGISYDILLTNTGDGILATGMARFVGKTTCDRCLAPAMLDASAEISCYYLHEEPEDEVEDESDFGLIDASDGTIDLAEAIQGGLAMEIPYVITCREDCKGLCPQCGANLNEVDCGCQPVHDPDFDRVNPFAALAALKFDDVEDIDPELDVDDEDEDDLDDEDFEKAWENRESAALDAE